MQLSKKQKSDFIFWGIFAGIIVFLFLTPWGASTRSWLSSLTLSAPDVESSQVHEEHLTTDWNLLSTDDDEVWITEFNQPIFINIWATWCPPCRAELPSIVDLYEQYKDRVTFLLVSPDEPIGHLKKFKEKNGYEIPFYNELSYTPDPLQTGSYPTTFILDKDLQVRYKMVGSHHWNSDEVHQLLDNIIAE